MFAGLKIMSTFATQMRNKLTQSKCPDGGIGRRVGLKHQWIHFHPGSIPGLGTKMERSFTSLLFSFIHLSIYTHLSLHIYPLTSYHIPHSTETENTGSHQKVH